MDMTDAQNKALKLLRIFDTVCTANNIKYSLCGDALRCLVYKREYNTINPNTIEVCLLLEDYLHVLEILEKYRDEYNITVANAFHTPEYDSIGSWLLYKDSSFVPAEREQDEIYYWTRIIITPVFNAGCTKWECRRVGKKIQDTLKILNARKPLPHKRWFDPIKNKIKRTRQRFYCYLQGKNTKSMQQLFSYLTTIDSNSEYVVLRENAKKITYMKKEEFKIERVSFFSVSVCAFISRDKLVKKDLRNENKKISDLLLKGGRDLRRIQLIQLEMLIEIDRICRKHGLKYNIAFGTLLGAVRHRGFIPWDDDADINMPYEDYVKLKAIIESELDHEKHYFRIQEKESDCNITYAHLKRNGTIYTKPGRDGFRYHPGVFIDIVPIFNGAPNFIFHTIQTRICWFFRTACWAYVGADSEKRFWKRQYYKCIRKIGNKRAYNQFIRFATFFKRKREKMLFLNGLDRSPYNIAFVKRECFDDSIEMEFEGHRFFAPRHYEDVLDYCYGKDWRRYPPLEARKPKNDVLIDIADLYTNI